MTEAEAKESSEIISMAETIIDEVVTWLLTEAADKFWKKKNSYCKNIARLLM